MQHEVNTMIEFRPISISDKDVIVKRLRAENSRSADYNFGNLIMWDSRFRKHIAVVEDRLIIDIRNSRCPRLECPYYVFPVGSGALRPAIDFMKGYADQKGCSFSMRGVTEAQRTDLHSPRQEIYSTTFILRKSFPPMQGKSFMPSEISATALKKTTTGISSD
jgi:hypothetical protein